MPDARVFLIGAGPGNPGLLTLRAAEVLAKADLILYDQLVPPRLLDLANPAAETLCVRDLPGNHPDKYPHIHARLIESARAGKIVVRLKGGDPLIFGRGGEEAEALREAGVPYEVVPGVTAALAAAAFLDLPLTHRNYASAVAFVTGHELPTKPGNKLNWQVLAAFPGTLAIYMGIARLPLIVAELLKYGKDPATPSVIVERASTGDMRTVTAPLAELDLARRNAGLESPGLILIGDAVAHRPESSWFQQRPLFGHRVLVTRPRHQAEPMMHRLEELGAVAYRLPTMEIRDADPGPVDAMLAEVRAGAWDWLAFASANGVNAVVRRALAVGDLRVFGRVKFAAIGPKTADALRAFHLKADVVPAATFNSEGLIESLRPHVQGQRVLLARANRGRDVLPVELAKFARVKQVTVYEQVDAVDTSSGVFDALRRGEIGFVTLTSSNVARGILAAFDQTTRDRVYRGEIRLVAISPETAIAVREVGFPVAGVAEVFTADGVIAEVCRLATSAGRA